ncbi:MAG: hypothetical protein AAGJ81_09170 [Verrucomicrobiota bacterium]
MNEAIALLGMVALALGNAIADDLHPDTPRFTAEQVLNGEFPGRKASPTVEAIHDATGFAFDRLYSVPAPGVHPRILFGPDDLPRIRSQIERSKHASKVLSDMRIRTDKTLSEGWVAEVYRDLAAGGTDGFVKLAEGSQKQIDQLSDTLEDVAFLALFDDDLVTGERNAAAITSYARWLQPQVDEASLQPQAGNHSVLIRYITGRDGGLGFMYDFSQPFMNEEQTETVRHLIASVTHGRYGLGMDLPPHWVNWNFIGFGLYFPLTALAIEGEEGYDPRIYQRGAELAENYILYGTSENGVGTEAMGYHTGGLKATALMMIAMANRGDNIFTLERWRRVLDTWAIHAMQPYGQEWVSSGDLGSFPPAERLVEVARFFFPEDERIAFVEQNLEDKRSLDHYMSLRWLQLVCPPDLDDEMEGLSMAQFGLPETLFDEQRGKLFTRTGWGEEDLYLQVVCRSDTIFASHDHADRGAFYLTSHGQPWAVSSMRSIESQYLNVVTINGRGQSHYAPPGKWIEVSDTPEATFAVVDTKYCYDWRWMKTSFLITDEQLENEPWLEWTREHRDRLLSHTPRELWERDPLPVVTEFYEGYMAGNPRFWTSEDSWVIRAPHYPVEKSFRTIGLIKGERPYVLIADDIRKDDAENSYQWRMRMPNWIEAYDISADEALLGRISERRDTSYRPQVAHNRSGRPLPQKGQPMLLVRVLQANQPDIPTYQDSMALETVGFVRHDDTFQFHGRKMGMGKRLMVPSRSVEPGYKILLFPHRHGDPLPTTELTDDGTKLTVAWEDQKDVFALSVNEKGRTVFELEK